MNRRTLLKNMLGVLGIGALGTLFPESAKPASAPPEILPPPLVDGSVASSALSLGPWNGTSAGGYFTGNNERTTVCTTNESNHIPTVLSVKISNAQFVGFLDENGNLID